MRNYLTLFLILITSVLSSYGQTPIGSGDNIDFLGRLSYGSLELSDVWGYADADGNEYALVGTFQGESIVDVNEPRLPEEVAFLPGATSTWRDIKTYKNFAYVSNETGGGLRIIDLSNLPNQPLVKDTVINSVTTIHNLWVDEAAGRLYLMGANQSSGGVIILDLNNDPWKPAYISAYSDQYVHDAYVRDNIAYMAEIYTGKLNILDVSDPGQLQLLGGTDYPNSFTHNTWLNDAGTVCFTTDEVTAAFVYAWDVSDPTDIQKLDRIRSNVSFGSAIPHNVHVLNDFLVISYYRDGIVIVDATNPASMKQVAHYDSSPWSGTGFNGVWGAYPFLPSGIILASDIEQGLVILETSYPQAAQINGMSVNSITGEPIEGVKVQVGEEVLYTDEIGSFFWNSGEEKETTFIFAKAGYKTQQLTLNVRLNDEFSPQIEMEPLIPIDQLNLQELEIAILTSNESPLGEAEFNLYPNPVNDLLTLNLNSVEAQTGDLSFEISNLQGQILREQSIEIGLDREVLDFPYAAGVYLGTLKRGEKILAIRKIVCVK